MENDSSRKQDDIFRKRSNLYAFDSVGDLKAYFIQFLPEKVIEETLSQAQQGFSFRVGASKQDTRLQFLKKCEILLSKKMNPNDI